MAKLTLQEQLLKAGLVTSKKAAKVERTAKKSRVQAREARAAVEENKKAQLERDKQLSEQQKQAALAKEYKAQVKQLIEMNHPHDVSEILASDGIDVRAGHHCAQPLLTYLGVNSSTRASFMFYNTLEEVDAFVKSVASIRRRMGYGE